jgi:hypothetical protein
MNGVYIDKPVRAVQGYTSGGRKQLQYVSIWLNRETHIQIHGPGRGFAAQLLEQLLNKETDHE